MRRKGSIMLVCVAVALGLATTARSWEEPQLEQKMARAQQLDDQVRSGLAGNHQPAAAEAAMELAALFDEIHDFWERKGMESAQERAHDVSVRAKAVAGLIERGDYGGAALAAKNMNGNCQGCHVAHGVPPAK